MVLNENMMKRVCGWPMGNIIQSREWGTPVPHMYRRPDGSYSMAELINVGNGPRTLSGYRRSLGFQEQNILI